MAYVSRSPPIIPDGQISRVRFETLGFLPKAFPGLERFKRWSVYTPAILVCLQPRLLSCRGVTPVLARATMVANRDRAPIRNTGATSGLAINRGVRKQGAGMA